MELEVRIERLGAQGDGAGGRSRRAALRALHASRRAGEGRGRARDRPRRSACRSRAEPGPCRAGLPNISAPAAAVPSSIWRPSAYLDWKREQVVDGAGLARARGRRSRRCAPCRSAAGGAPLSRLAGDRQALALRLSRAPARMTLSTSRPARCSPPASSGACPSSSCARAAAWRQARSRASTVTETEQGLDIVVEGIRPSPALFASLPPRRASSAPPASRSMARASCPLRRQP